MRPLRILTWHIHGNYLYYLSHAGQEFYLPARPVGGEGYGGRGTTFPWLGNVHDVPAEQVRELDFDCILFQSRKNFLYDQFEILSESQRRLPRIYLEHDPPQEHPTNSRHPVDDPNALLIHVTPFNHLMWDSGTTPTRVIEHGVKIPDGVRYTGELERGIVVVNHLRKRGRRLGSDVFSRVRDEIPLDLVGMDAESMAGLGEVFPPHLPEFISHYRFFFNPIRYTSLGLAVCEAMTVGMPIVGLATTEMVTAVQTGVTGFVETDVEALIVHMRRLLEDPQEARRLGENGGRAAQTRFSIERFARDWNQAFEDVAGRCADSVGSAVAGSALS
jgi:hypothetical protein